MQRAVLLVGVGLVLIRAAVVQLAPNLLQGHLGPDRGAEIVHTCVEVFR